jgi:tRNA threonylcarbamoyladenosine modification (KEOPS) complex  Pcc1 subunit
VRAELEIECANPDIVIKAITPDVAESGKFSAELKKEKKSVKLTVESKDIVGLLAGINSYARLIKTSTETNDLEE